MVLYLVCCSVAAPLKDAVTHVDHSAHTKANLVWYDRLEKLAGLEG